MVTVPETSSATFPPEPSSRRTAATWIAGTGTFLLLAAATLFVAVRWDQLPDMLKLGVLLALTAGSMVAGRGLRRSFPATGGVLFHLGALLLPVDLAAVNLRVGLGWRGLLLAEGVLAAGALGWLASSSGPLGSRSVVLTWAARAGVAATAAGVAAISPLPGPLLVAIAALTAYLLGHREAAVAGSVLAGLAPLHGLVITALVSIGGNEGGVGVLQELGLAGRSQALMAVASGAIAAVVLGREAASRRDLSLVAIAGVSLASGGLASWVAVGPSFDVNTTGLAGLFLTVQVAALLLRRDAFWARPARWLAGGAEGVVVVGTVTLLVASLLLIMIFDPGWSGLPGPDLSVGLSLGLVSLGWTIGALRRIDVDGSMTYTALAALGHPLGVLATVTGVCAVAAATGSPAPTALALVVAAALLVAAPNELAGAVAALSAWAAPALVWSRPALAVPLAAAAGVVMAVGAIRRSRQTHDVRISVSHVMAHVMALVACACVAQGPLALVGRVDAAVALMLAVGAFWALANLMDQGRQSLGDVARAAMAVPAVVALALSPRQALAVSAVAALGHLLEAVRLDRPMISVGAAAAIQLVLIHACRLGGLDIAEAGVVLCVGAAVWSGLAVLANDQWRFPLLFAAGAGVSAGLILAAGDGRMLANALMVSGALGAGAGLATRNMTFGHIGGAMLVSGVIGHLAQSDVSALEAYMAPVSAQLLVLGVQRHRAEGLSSWWAYGPPVGLLGGSAFLERLAGGPGWHAVLAGAVGMAAMVAGGWRRLAGPLVLGTALVVTVTVVESLPALAGVPTWGWLATGGAFLLLSGLALERTETSPVQVGRRLVDVIDERFQ